MLTMPDVLTATADLFGQLGLAPLLAVALILALVALLVRRVKVALQTDPDDPYAGSSAAERQHAQREDELDWLEETDPDEFHRLVEEDAEFAALVAESEAWWAEGRQQMFGDGAPE